MNDKLKWITMFNNKFEEFIKDLILLHPEDPDFKAAKTSFNMLKIVDENKPYELFKHYGKRYEVHVKKKDDNFFLNHSYDEELKTAPNFTDDIIVKLKQYWIKMNNENKETIWKYLEVLYKINDKLNNI